MHLVSGLWARARCGELIALAAAAEDEQDRGTADPEQHLRSGLRNLDGR
jgi:hypothetical protein